ncbi:MAG: sugar phosphate isomerase/epimerase [Eubacterium sp.]|nr:sugar phosphate isomerase/epimerase [Eubacterium sp.]
MKISYNETFPSRGLEEDLLLCEEIGYDLIELRIPFLREYLKTHALNELKEFFRNHHLKPYAFNSVNDFNFVTVKEWYKMMDDFLFACRMCQELECQNIVLVSTEREDMQFVSEDRAFDSSVPALRKLCDIAEPYGARIALEPIGHRNWCVRSLSQTLDILREVNRDNLGLTLDAFNIFINASFEDLAVLDEIPPEKIFVFHINDAMNLPIDRLMPAEHRLFPGDGIIPLEQLLLKFREIGYLEMASLEVFGDWVNLAEPAAALREGYEKTRKTVNRVFH